MKKSGVHELILRYKYADAVQKVSRGITHDYNNLFTGLGGQTAKLMQEARLGEVSAKRKKLVADLLERGRERTELLFSFSRDIAEHKHICPAIKPAVMAADLLSCISRAHQFEVVNQNHSFLVCKPRQICLTLFFLGEKVIEAMPEGGIIELSIKMEDYGGRYERDVVFSFSCQGQEIASHPFEFLSASIRSDDEGGLTDPGGYAASFYAQMNSGVIELLGNGGGCAGIALRFPARVVEKDKAAPAGGSIIDSGRKEDGQDERLCVLVVDDDRVVRSVLLDRLRKRGHMVFCVSTCGEAVEEFEMLSDVISLILLDIGLKDCSGFECCRRLAEIGDHTPTVILMSGQQPEATEMQKVSHDGFIQKPFRMSELEEVLRNVSR